MARWLRRSDSSLIPAWVWDDVGAAEVDRWLDDLYDQDPERWGQAFIEIISTPTYSNGSAWGPGG